MSETTQTLRAADFPIGARVRVQMNGVPTTYLATVVEPDEWQRDAIDALHPGRYVWVMPDDVIRQSKSGGAVNWRPESLTLLDDEPA